MKLLFDENLSPRLVSKLADVFPDSAHVDRIGLGSEPDAVIWEYAKTQGYTWSARIPTSTKEACFTDILPRWCGFGAGTVRCGKSN